MKIKAVSEITNLSDRTIRYYIEQKLIFPLYFENYLGRKSFDFSQENIDELKNIAVLRKFDFSIEEIREIINDAEKSKTVIQNVKARTQEIVADGQRRQSSLSRIQDDKAYTLAELAQELSKASEDLPKTEETIKKNIGKKVLMVIKTIMLFLIVWLPVAFQLLFFVVTVMFYDYPKFFPQSVLYMSLSVLPSLLILLFGRIKKGRKKIAKIILLILCMISVLCSCVVSILPVGMMAISETTDIKEYRDVDADCLANRDLFFQELFPVWPNYFENVKQADGHFETVYLDAHYYYRFLSVMDYTYDIYAEWPLAEDEFCKEVDRVTELFKANAPALKDRNRYHDFVTIEKGSYTCLVLYHSYGGDLVFEEATDNYTYYIFAYDEENLKVRYICCCSLENGADQPYYLSLDW